MATGNSKGATRPIGARVENLVMRLMSSGHIALYRATGGKFGGSMFGAPVLLLTTTGRKTGKRRTTPLMYLRDGADLVIVASKGGSPKDPVWWLNLKQTPEAEVRVGAETLRVRAEQAAPEERRRLWPLLTAMYKGYADYEKKTTREIPVGILHRVG